MTVSLKLNDGPAAFRPFGRTPIAKCVDLRLSPLSDAGFPGGPVGRSPAPRGVGSGPGAARSPAPRGAG